MENKSSILVAVGLLGLLLLSARGCPGPVEPPGPGPTETLDKLGLLIVERAGDRTPEQAAALNMLKRTGEPDDIAGPVCFLFSDDAAFMTGKTLVPDGGEVHMSVSMVTPPAAAS